MILPETLHANLQSNYRRRAIPNSYVSNSALVSVLEVFSFSINDG